MIIFPHFSLLRLGHMLWGNCSAADHSINLLLHAGVTLLYAHTLLHALRLTPLQVLLSGLTFATHPVHTEAVGSESWGKGNRSVRRRLYTCLSTLLLILSLLVLTYSPYRLNVIENKVKKKTVIAKRVDKLR